MSLHELHPEELLDRAEQGTLTAEERKILDDHLASCAVCRMEMVARDDFRVGEEQVFSDAELDSILGASLQAATPQKRAAGARTPAGAWRPNRRWAVLLAAAVLLVSAQATARWMGFHAPAWMSSSKETLSSPNGSVTEPAPKAVVVPQPPPAVPITTAAPVDTTPAPVDPPKDNEAKAAIPHATAAHVESAPSANVLFAQANVDREQGKHVVAAEEYRTLLRTYPDAPEADLARATLGRLLLDDGDAAGALPLFDAYLRTGGPLREETMVNRATALERLHREADEAAAWQALLDAYPGSMHADHAAARLKELGAR